MPPLYQSWVTALLGGTLPHEGKATCEDCAMCPSAGEPLESRHFSPQIKCCGYCPDLPNFLVGRILNESDRAAVLARDVVDERVARRVAVTPLGLHPSAKYDLLYNNAPNTFGQSMSMRCPYFIDEQGGRCGVWKHRNAVCATWFCKHERGAVGLAFWQSLRNLLTAIEHNLALWCALELNPGVQSLSKLVSRSDQHGKKGLTAAELDDQYDPHTYAALRGEWLDREREFFGRRATLVAPLKWSEVLSITGPKVRASSELALAGYQKLMSNQIPDGLRPSPVLVAPASDDRLTIQTYSSADPLSVPFVVLSLLHYFDGRATTDVLEDIERMEGVRMSPELVRKLADFRVLTSER